MGLTEKNWNRWLSSKDGLAFLRACAKNILRNPGYRNLTSKIINEALHYEPAPGVNTESSFAPFPDEEKYAEHSGHGPGRSGDDLLNGTISALCLFIADKPAVRAGLLGCILQDSQAKASGLLKKAFILHMKDQLRRRKEEPWYGYYRRAAKTIAEQEDFTIHTTSQGSFFAACRISNTQLPPAPEFFFSTTDFSQWPFPNLPDDTSTKQNLIRLARFFYTRARSLVGHDCLLPVRAFVNYVMAKGGLRWLNVSHVFPDQPAEDNDHHFCPELPDQERICGPGPEQMDALARNLFSGWSERQRAAFCMKYHRELTLNEIAGKLGYSGPSGVSALLYSLKSGLLETMSAWPGLSPPDLDENLCDEFINMLISFCKNDPSIRKYQERK